MSTPRIAGEGSVARGGTPLRRGVRIVRSIVLTLAGVAGVLVLLAALAPLAGFQLVRLQTGSMSPGFPAGSVLLVQDVAAREAVVGDIVTVRRFDGAPVTHRIVATSPTADGAVLTLRGDANDTPDAEQYRVTRVGHVLGGIPVGGAVFDALRGPAAIPVLTGVVSLLVIWAWWPERRTPAHRAHPATGGAA